MSDAEPTVIVVDSMNTWTLLQHLRETRTDLACLVEKALSTRSSTVVVAAAAVRAWSTREPGAWARVHQWLESRQIDVRVA